MNQILRLRREYFHKRPQRSTSGCISAILTVIFIVVTFLWLYCSCTAYRYKAYRNNITPYCQKNFYQHHKAVYHSYELITPTKHLQKPERK